VQASKPTRPAASPEEVTATPADGSPTSRPDRSDVEV